ncbi:hypothetical protein pEaSNUABM11_00230 [Erwinia phage pEa_SNUABM_11]|nr:hypothetical protein pEaSNUABM11_00230 [Erwinia phage pEa_SNUABM_11]
MARIPLTPPINTEGVFKINNPFVLSQDVMFRVDAISNFTDLQRRNIDPYATYYQPAGVSNSDYLDDANAGASIITFKSNDGQVVYIPDTYIETYPGAAGVSYVRNVLVWDCGPVPDYVDIAALNADAQAVLEKGLGVTINGQVTTLAYEGVISDEDHVRMEAERKAKIRETTPLSEQVADLTARNTELQTLVDRLTAIVAANASN